MSANWLAVSAFGLTASLASAQPLPGPEAMCLQGQCASGSYCDFSALPNPICRAVPSASPSLPSAPAPSSPLPSSPPSSSIAVPAPPPAPSAPSAPSAPAPAAPVAAAPSAAAPSAAPAEEPLFRLGFAADGVGEQLSVYRHVGIGSFGHRSVPIFTSTGSETAPAAGPDGVAQVALITGRWWATQTVGVDVGLGVLLEGTSVEQSSGSDATTFNVPEVGAFLLHVGVPWAVTQNENVTMLVIPSLELGVTNRTTDNEAQPEQPLQESGFLFAVNVRAGAEVHLGFIGLPQVAIESTIGVGAAVELSAVAQDDQKVSQSRTRIVMPVATTPLDLFLSQLAIRYYF